jgi:Ca2+/Na+ antiporter
MVNNYIDITNNYGKVYMSFIMALYMVLIDIMMHDHQYNKISVNLYLILFILIGILIYVYRNQIGINDKQYLEGMIEHHSMAILTSQEIIKKSDDYNVLKLAKTIVQQQEDEIKKMREIINKL